jgi:hypothetical protein
MEWIVITWRVKVSLNDSLKIAIEEGNRGLIKPLVLSHLIVEIQKRDEKQFRQELKDYWCRNHDEKIAHKIKQKVQDDRGTG